MRDGWITISVRKELFEAARKYYRERREELKLKDGVRSFKGLVNFALREHMKDRGII